MIQPARKRDVDTCRGLDNHQRNEAEQAGDRHESNPVSIHSPLPKVKQ